VAAAESPGHEALDAQPDDLAGLVPKDDLNLPIRKQEDWLSAEAQIDQALTMREPASTQQRARGMQ
jgi:hypothetical protein